MGDTDWRWVLLRIENSIPFLGMVAAVTALALNMTVSQMAMSKGTSFYILSVYSHASATLILFPCGFLFHRSKFPPLTFSVLSRIFLLAFFGDIAAYAGINQSSATLGSELLNLVPGFTYILAISFRMEQFSLRRSSDIAKSLGTVVSIVGASIATLYNGAAILNKGIDVGYAALILPSEHNWIIGGFLLAAAAFSVAAWTIFQASILKLYPAQMIVVAFYCLFVTIQSTVVALIAEKDLTAWKLQSEMAPFAVIYAGIINIAFRIYVLTWCVSKTGPLFVSLFNPLTIIVSAIIGVIFFHEVFYIGSVIGAVVLVIGFYAVIWGNAKESRLANSVAGAFSESTNHDDGVPLLVDYSEQA